MNTASQKKQQEQYMAEDDLRTLARAKEIKSDKARLRRAMALAKSQLAAVESK